MDIRIYECCLCGKYFGGHSGNFFKCRPLMCGSCAVSELSKAREYYRRDGLMGLSPFLDICVGLRYMRGAWAES